MKTILAIDPGASGGFAVLHSQSVFCEPMPDTEGDVAQRLFEIKHAATLEGYECVAYVEEVGGFTGKGQPGSAMFKFGRGFGFILGCLHSNGYRIELVRPQKWQKHFGLGTASSCESKTEWKNKLKAHAQRLFPTVKNITLKTADALLIGEFAKRSESNEKAE